MARTEDYLALLDRQTRRQVQRAAETETLVESGQLTLADRASVRADTAELAWEWRKTLWEAILLLTQEVVSP